MPLVHCPNCHHEWETSAPDKDLCDCCEAPAGRILEEETPFERFLRALPRSILDDIIEERRKRPVLPKEKESR